MHLDLDHARIIRVVIDPNGVEHWVADKGYCPDHDHTVVVGPDWTPHPESAEFAALYAPDAPPPPDAA